MQKANPHKYFRITRLTGHGEVAFLIPRFTSNPDGRMGVTTMDAIDRRVLDSMTGADKIRTLLNGRGFTFKSFARSYNVWVQEVSDWVNGRNDDEEIAAHVSDCLGISVADLLTLREQGGIDDEA